MRNDKVSPFFFFPQTGVLAQVRKQNTKAIKPLKVYSTDSC